MQEKLVVANWKMNGNTSANEQLLSALIAGVTDIANQDSKCQMVICPPSIFIDQVARICKNTALAVGGQNIANFPSGAYTGEVSAAMLREFAVTFAIIGHSERRTIYRESDQIVAERLVQACQAGIRPILCIGETLEQRQSGDTKQILLKQLSSVFDYAMGKINKGNLSTLLIAYEPVWAIGSGLAATTEQIGEVHLFIREYLCKTLPSDGKKIAILYGGSVKANNAAEIFAINNVDGGLIGGASLHAEEFLAIYQAANN